MCYIEVDMKLQMRIVHVSLIKAVGIDLAILVMSIHGVYANDKNKLRKTVKRNKRLAGVDKLQPAIIV